ncbi:ribonuclease R [Athalassotoga saccharophila]|uniref:ribonuclease R n=1 Tax=Athalassotoga saccharophila TaxID=1441386 RepID=UPI001379E723|nr:ribonuclease R [Athalassotoga saccharophila]BBJ27883.1 ribonuclease R [Athalassotoga saccharophila]
MTREELVKYFNSKSYAPSTITAIAQKTNSKVEELKDLLEDLEEEGFIYRTRSGKWHKVKENEMVGIIKFTRSGKRAFVTSSSGREASVEIANTMWALNGDKVLVEITKNGEDIPSGKVVKILERSLNKIVGVYKSQWTNFGYLIPDDPRIIYEFRVYFKDSIDVKDGDKIVAKITRYPDSSAEGTVEIVEKIGRADLPQSDLPSVIEKYNLPKPEEFPKSVIKAIKKLPDDVGEKDIQGRKDFRGKHVFTIDGEDAKDFDDAVSIEKLPNGNYLLGVHIADVSNYVKEGDPVDIEAFKRGTSVYLIDTVIPMLPFKLSNDLCSLVEGKDRLTVSAEMEIDEYGRILKKQFSKSVIRSVKRLTYTKVTKLLEDPDQEIENEIGFIRKDLEMMRDLAHTIKTSRLGRGSIEFASDEVKVILDENGYVKDIVLRKQNVAEMMIEEFMISANESVAELFDRIGFPFIYRIHGKPDVETIAELSEYLRAIGIKFKITENIQPIMLQRILEQIKGHPLEMVIQRLLVRSMKKAVYSETNVGHFGLASLNYTHFTSPIRRYPDLMVHRLLKIYIEKGKFSNEEVERYSKILPSIAKHSSEREIIADQAERDLVSMKKIEYAQNHIGEVFDVVVTGVTDFGLFVEIPDKAISGLIHISTLNDYYIHDEKFNTLTGTHGKIFKIGDKLRAKITSADKIKGMIDFVLEDENGKDREGKNDQKVKKNRRAG